MCGITGFWDFNHQTADPDRVLATMARAIQTRGPDAQDQWADEKAGVYLGHRRLSIQDLSKHGAQPMHSVSGRYVIVYNGEVYNAPELAKELDYQWRGHSDTEVILAAIEEWGLKQAVQRFNGMFGIALYDREERTISLVRDRIGIKPVYYGIDNGCLFFGSEMKSFFAHPLFQPSIDPEALDRYLQYLFVPTPRSIFKEIRKQRPGTILTISADQEITEQTYWRLGFNQAPDVSIKDLLTKAVERRLLADVPLGAFLSGGLDSSTVVALMQGISDDPVRTFSIGFEEKEYDEAPIAREIAGILGTKHTELYVTGKEALDVVPKIPMFADEPFADRSLIPTFLVSKMARRHVTVALSGDGGDELFAGYYYRYVRLRNYYQKFRKIPRFLRAGASYIPQLLTPNWLGAKSRHLNFRAQKIHNALKFRTLEEFYAPLVSHGERGYDNWPKDRPDFPDSQAAMQWLDLHSYLPDDPLAKVDRASMAHSLEVRVPFLDHTVVEAAFSLPSEEKLKDGLTKMPVRNILQQYLPQEILSLPKKGFSPPVSVWLRNDLKEWAGDLLEMQDDQVDLRPVRQLFQDHLNGHNRDQQLWQYLMYLAWRQHWKV